MMVFDNFTPDALNGSQSPQKSKKGIVFFCDLFFSSSKSEIDSFPQE